jgi:hypothetical protein
LQGLHADRDLELTDRHIREVADVRDPHVLQHGAVGAGLLHADLFTGVGAARDGDVGCRERRCLRDVEPEQVANELGCDVTSGGELGASQAEGRIRRLAFVLRGEEPDLEQR